MSVATDEERTLTIQRMLAEGNERQVEQRFGEDGSMTSEYQEAQQRLERQRAAQRDARIAQYNTSEHDALLEAEIESTYQYEARYPASPEEVAEAQGGPAAGRNAAGRTG